MRGAERGQPHESSVSLHTTSSICQTVLVGVDSLDDLFSKPVEDFWSKRLGEDVSDVLRRGHVEELDCLLADVVPHEVVPDVDVLRELVVDVVLCNVASTFCCRC